MEESGNDAFGIHVDVGENVGDGEGMGNIFFTAITFLVGMSFCGD
jgi:hypothetical protein